jgi:integrin beta 3
MTALELKSFAVDLALQTKAAIAAAVAPYDARVKALEAEIATLRDRAPVPGPMGPDGPRGAEGAAGRDGQSVDPALVKSLIVEEVSRAAAAIERPRDGRDGKDADLEAVKMLVDAAVAARSLPKDGRDGVDGKDGPPGRDGKDGAPGKDGRDGIDGKDGAPGVNGKDGRDGVDGKDGATGVHGKDGIDGRAGVTGLNGKDGIDGKDGAPGLNGKDGAGVTGGVIDREGHLILTLSDGGTKDVGLVVGKSAEVSDVQRFVEAQLATWERPTNGEKGLDGKDGLGFDELDVIFDEATGYALRFTRGAEVKNFRIAVPWYAGTWQAGRRYPKGAMLTHKGGEWTAKADTFEKPGQSAAWQLSTKGGRDGRDAPGVRGDE